MELHDSLSAVDPTLGKVILAIAQAVAEIAVVLRTASTCEVGSTNAFGDKQLQADLQADDIVFQRLRDCKAVCTASSEEQTVMLDMGGKDYSVGRIANMRLQFGTISTHPLAVGSIFGIWKGRELLGRTGRQQAAAAYAVYGPRTVLVLARPQAGDSGPHTVEEFVLAEGCWRQKRANITLLHSKRFAPANLRASAENKAYRDLVAFWQSNCYTLRYTGAMVPDIHHILQAGGIFCNPSSASAPAKLRLLYECAPLAFIVEAAGGLSLGKGGRMSILDLQIDNADQRTVISLGAAEECRRTVPALLESQPGSDQALSDA